MIDTKEYIIDQAYKLFLNHSYEAVSISDISKSVGMTKGALYHHFLNKEELFMAVVDKYVNFDMGTEIRQYDSFPQFIDESIEKAKRSIYSTIGEESDFIPINILTLVIDALRHYPGFDENKARLFNTEIENTRNALSQAIERKEIRNDIDIDITAMNVFSISLGLAANLYTYKSPSRAIDTLKQQLYEFYKLLKV